MEVARRSRMKRFVRYTHGFALITAVLSTILSAVAGLLLLQIILNVIEAKYHSVMITIAFALLGGALLLSTINLFTPLYEFLQYPLRVLEAMLVTLASLGALITHAYLLLGGGEESLRWAFLTIIVFMVSLGIFYSMYFRKGMRGEHILYHKTALERLTGVISRAASRIGDSKLADELLEANNTVNASWSRVVKKEFVERGDVSKAFIQALYVSIIYYLAQFPAGQIQGVPSAIVTLYMIAAFVMMMFLALDVYYRGKVLI